MLRITLPKIVWVKMAVDPNGTHNNCTAYPVSLKCVCSTRWLTTETNTLNSTHLTFYIPSFRVVILQTQRSELMSQNVVLRERIGPLLKVRRIDIARPQAGCVAVQYFFFIGLNDSASHARHANCRSRREYIRPFSAGV